MTGLEALLNKTVNKDCGLITSLVQIPVLPCEPDLHIYTATYQDPFGLQPDPHLRIPVTARITSGIGLTSTSAMWATVGEAIERYSCANWAHLDTVEASAMELPGGEEILSELILFSDESYARGDIPFFPADAKKPRAWLRGFGLSDEREVFVPATLTVMFYLSGYNHELIDKTYSTGVACHTDRTLALYNAICEIVERDAYASYWLTQTRPNRLSEKVLQELVDERLYKRMRDSPLDFAVCPLVSDIDLPTFCTMTTLPGGGVATGSASRLDVTAALEKSVLECMHTLNWCFQMRQSGDGDLAIKAEDVNLFEDHVRYYVPEARTDEFAWHPQYLSRVDWAPSSWGASQAYGRTALKEVVSKVEAAGFQVIGVDLSSPDIVSLGLRVMRVLVPGTQPLYAGYDAVHTDVRRLNAFLSWGGGEREEWTAADVSKCPLHPFP